MRRFNVSTFCAAMALLASTTLSTPSAAAVNQPAPKAAALSMQEAEKLVIAVLDRWVAAYNKHDFSEWEKLYHFPHYRLSSGKMAVLDAPGLQDAAKVWPPESDAHHGAWDHRRVVAVSNDKIHVDTQYSVFRADGSKITSFHSFFIFTHEGGRWGVKMRSSFAP